MSGDELQSVTLDLIYAKEGPCKCQIYNYIKQTI